MAKDDREWQVTVTFHNHSCPYLVAPQGCQYPVNRDRVWDVDLQWEECSLERCPIESDKAFHGRKE